MPDTPILTRCRVSLLTAINSWVPLRADEDDTTATLFKRIYTPDAAAPPGWKDLAPTGIGEMPALAILPLVTTEEWMVNQMMQVNPVYTIVYWTPHWNSMPLAESLFEGVIDAIYRGTEAGQSVPAVKRSGVGTGFYPVKFGPVTMRPITLGGTQGDPNTGIKAIRTEIGVMLRIGKNPIVGP